MVVVMQKRVLVRVVNEKEERSGEVEKLNDSRKPSAASELQHVTLSLRAHIAIV